MEANKASDIPIRKCLESVGVSSLGDWDVLMFLYRRQFTLANAEQIARLLGHPRKTVGEALERLESRTLIRRSRSSGGSRFYQFKRSEAMPGAAHGYLRRLIDLAETRAGRLLLVEHFRQPHALAAAAKGETT